MFAQRLEDDAAQLVVHSSRQPDMTRMYRFAAYNVGWIITDKGRSAARLADELVEVWRAHNFHAMGVSEVFEVDYPAATLDQVNARRQAILDEVVAAFKAIDDAQWQGRVDGHCFYLWNSLLGLQHADYIRTNHSRNTSGRR